MIILSIALRVTRLTVTPESLRAGLRLRVLAEAPRRSLTRSMSLFVDKHRPTKLDDLHFHHDLSQRIRSLVR